MDDREIAALLRRVHERVNELADLLAECTAAPPAARAGRLQSMRAHFDEFSDQLRRRMALEEQGGYMDMVLQRRPTLQRQVDRLAEEHRQLGELIEFVQCALAECVAANPMMTEECCRRVRRLLDCYRRHDRSEIEVFTSAFTQDIGVRD